MERFSGLLRAGVLLALAITIGVIGYRVVEGYTWLDALYMTAVTLSTVGYREVQPLSPAGQIFTMLLLAGGLGVVFYTVVALVQKAVEGEFQQFFGSRRMQKRIDAMVDHYIVCGFGRIGEVVCRELASKPVPFVTIELSENRAREAEAAGYVVIRGDAADEEVLFSAGARRAKVLFSALATDADNVFVTLNAKEMNSSLFVVARGENDRSERTLRRAGADKVVSPYAMGGHRMAQAALRPAVVDVIDLATHSQSVELQMEEIVIAPSSGCVGVALQDAGLSRIPGAMVVAIKRSSGSMLLNPDPEEKLEVGDCLIVLAETQRLREIEERVRGKG